MRGVGARVFNGEGGGSKRECPVTEGATWEERGTVREGEERGGKQSIMAYIISLFANKFFVMLNICMLNNFLNI